MKRQTYTTEEERREGKRAASLRYYYKKREMEMELNQTPEPLISLPPLKADGYEFKGVKQFCNKGGAKGSGQRPILYFQVIEFNCPHCQTIIEKNVPVEGWHLVLFCKQCNKQYEMDVKPLVQI